MTNFFSPWLDSHLEVIQIFTWALFSQRWGGVVQYSKIVNKQKDVSNCHSFLSYNHVNFKEKRSLISYIQQFTSQCFSLDIQ